MIVVVMGVSGSGKTTVGQLLAEQLGWPFFEGDDLHPPENIEKLRGGTPLSDEDRAPWLAALRRLLAELARAGRDAVVACSALKKSYRDGLRGAGGDVRFVHLSGDVALIDARLAARSGHFMSGSLLGSQIETLEAPGADEAVIVDVAMSPEAIVADIFQRLRVGPAP